jgi:glycosyltransferase involved in cell wall biosynthesis
MKQDIESQSQKCDMIPMNTIHKRIIIFGNRIGMYKGDTGGGSIFRSEMVKSLSTNHLVESISLETKGVDIIETKRGPMLSLSLNNIRIILEAMLSNDIIIQSGSYTPLLVLCAYISRITGTVSHTFITMNSQVACETNYNGINLLLAYTLYMGSDCVNSYISSSTWTRSAEFLSILKSSWVWVRGVVYLESQYNVFRQVDPAQDIDKVRQHLTLKKKGLPVLLYVGRIVKEKRIELLIANKPENCILVILGGGAHSNVIAGYHSPENNVICFVDRMLPQDYIRQCYRACDIMVSASNYETLGNTVMESLLCNNPVIVENAGGYKTQVINGQNGWLVDWTDKQEVLHAFEDIMSGGLTLMKPLNNPNSRSLQDIIKGSPTKGFRLINIVVIVLGLPVVTLYLLLAWIWQTFGTM